MTEATRPGMIVGTVAYMSPEQASGRTLDARSDVFSFGVLLYEQLAGRRPFSGGSDLEVLKTIIHGDAEPLDADVPLAVRMAVDKALAKDPAERYQTMRDFVVDLRRAPRHTIPDASTSERRSPRLWMAAAVILPLLAGAAGWMFRGASVAAENPLVNAKFTRFTDFDAAEADAAISPDGRFVAFLSDRDGPFDIFLSQVGTGRFVNLTKGQQGELRSPTRSVGFSSDGSEIWSHGPPPNRLFLMPLVGGAPRAFLNAKAVNVQWSPDGTSLVYHTRDDGDPIFLADRNGGTPRLLFVNPSRELHNHFPVWSRDGQWIYFARGIQASNEMDVWRMAVTGGQPERLTQHNNLVAYPTPISQSTVLYIARDQDGSGPWLWALDAGRKTTRRVSFGLEQYTSISASADGRRLVATVSNPTASLWSVPILDHIAEEREVKPFPVGTVRALAPRFGGSSLFYLSSRGTGDGLWRYQNGQASEIWRGADGALLEPQAVAPDGRISLVLRKNGKLQLNLLSADGAERRAVADSIDVQGSASWSPDGKWIVTGGSDSKGPGLFKIPVDGGPPVRLVSGLALDPVWSPEGSMIVYTGPNVGSFAPLLAVGPDGTRQELPPIEVRVGGERMRFLPGGKTLIYMQGRLQAQDFWMLDLPTRKSRQLTRLNNTTEMRTFDITPDGKQVVFDRLRENSDIVLIDLPQKP
jgi:Tol biopolymer transport system component